MNPVLVVGGWIVALLMGFVIVLLPYVSVQQWWRERPVRRRMRERGVESVPEAERPLTGWRRAKDILTIVASWIFAVGFTLIMLTPWFDTLDPRWVACDVTRARVSQSSSVAGGTRVTHIRVRVDTSDCGGMSIDSSVRGMSANEMAGDIEPGQTYEFKLGPLSRWSREHPERGHDVYIQDYRRQG